MGHLSCGLSCVGGRLVVEVPAALAKGVVVIMGGARNVLGVKAACEVEAEAVIMAAVPDAAATLDVLLVDKFFR